MNESFVRLRDRVMDDTAMVLDNQLGADYLEVDADDWLREDLGMTDNDIYPLLRKLEIKFFCGRKLIAGEWIAVLSTNVAQLVDFIVSKRPVTTK